MTAFTQIPVVSLEDWRTSDHPEQFARHLVEICHHVGFFTLVDHGVDREFLERYVLALKAFFALPVEVKEKIEKKQSPWFRGWERIGSELTDNKVDYREQLDLSTEHASRPRNTEPPYLRLDGPNPWLSETDLPGFHAVVEEFIGKMSSLANEIMGILAVGLGLEQDAFRVAFGERPLSLVKLVSYPPTPAGMAGVNSHHDAGFLTLLLQHDEGGLQAMNPDGVWIDVPPTPHAFVVNLGEMLQAMTGNYLVATTHRVISPAQRYSSAYFHGPDLRTSLDPIDLAPEYSAAVAASPWHRDAGFMAKREELLHGQSGTASETAPVYGQQLWNYYLRSYPEVVRRHYPELVP